MGRVSESISMIDDLIAMLDVSDLRISNRSMY